MYSDRANLQCIRRVLQENLQVLYRRLAESGLLNQIEAYY